jgi:16S rRNA (guanine(966)-N(2))-methyltransferase RsmD
MRCLDLFAGSGALGFEAASRGASEVLMIEAFTPAFKQLEQNKLKLKADAIHLQRGDAFLVANSLLKQQRRFDIIFLDPPFNQGFLEKILPLCVELLAEHGLLYVEAEQTLPELNAVVEEVPLWCAAWEVLRKDQAGSVFFHLLQRNKEVGKIP